MRAKLMQHSKTKLGNYLWCSYACFNCTLHYRLAFAQRFFCAAEIFALVAALIFQVRFFPAFTPVTAAVMAATLLPFSAWMAASTPASFLASEARSSWSIFNKVIINGPF